MGQSATELRRDIERTREGLGETLDAIGDRVSPGRIVERRKNRMTSGLRTAKERIMGTIDDATQAVSERAHDLGDDATDALDQMKEMPGGVRERTQGAPMIAGAIAFGVGFLVAAAFPASEAEREVEAKVMAKVEPLREELTSAGKELAGHLKQPAVDAANQVKGAAKESAQSITDTAKSVAHDTADEAKSAAESVKDGVQQTR
jgi:hypothetical protein